MRRLQSPWGIVQYDMVPSRFTARVLQVNMWQRGTLLLESARQSEAAACVDKSSRVWNVQYANKAIMSPAVGLRVRHTVQYSE